MLRMRFDGPGPGLPFDEARAPYNAHAAARAFRHSIELNRQSTGRRYGRALLQRLLSTGWPASWLVVRWMTQVDAGVLADETADILMERAGDRPGSYALHTAAIGALARYRVTGDQNALVKGQGLYLKALKAAAEQPSLALQIGSEIVANHFIKGWPVSAEVETEVFLLADDPTLHWACHAKVLEVRADRERDNKKAAMLYDELVRAHPKWASGVVKSLGTHYLWGSEPVEAELAIQQEGAGWYAGRGTTALKYAEENGTLEAPIEDRWQAGLELIRNAAGWFEK